jgi:hypothetical protein
VDTSCAEHEYGETKVVWFESGSRVLDYIETDERFNANSFADSLEEQGVATDRSDLESLISNMKALSKHWRRSIGEHGELLFMVDA